MNGEVEITTIRDYEGLFRAFDCLERGRSVLLRPDGREAPTELPANGEAPRIGLFSSGTLGEPKMVWKDWAGLKSQAGRSRHSRSLRWAASFLPWTYAGAQVGLQAWTHGGGVTPLSSDWEGNWRLVLEREATALSCTPTFLDLLGRHAVSSTEADGDLRMGRAIRQITLGGECLRRAQGVRFQSWFSRARFNVIYASAEHGVLLKTQRLDGWFETKRFGSNGVEWKMENGVLFLLSDGEWAATNDLIELNADRSLARIVGRADRVANVAGTKVRLEEVVFAAESIDGVHGAVAFAEANAVSGEIVALKYEIRPGANARAVEARLKDHLRARLPKAAWPRRWILGSVQMGANGKRETGSVFMGREAAALDSMK